MSKRKVTNSIVVHCSDSIWGSAMEINKWHIEKGWAMCGYHFIILNGSTEPRKYIKLLDGSIEVGRRINEIGAHCRGYNSSSIGICLIGKNKFTDNQMESLNNIISTIMGMYGNMKVVNILGHYELNKNKTCPNFNMDEYRKSFVKFITPSPEDTKRDKILKLLIKLLQRGK